MIHPNDLAFSDYATRMQMETPDGIVVNHPSLTKREYFAAMAMQGMLSNHVDFNVYVDNIAAYSVEYADALIKALNETK